MAIDVAERAIWRNPRERTRLLERARAAREAVADGVDGPLALSYAVWPSVELVRAQEEAERGVRGG